MVCRTCEGMLCADQRGWLYLKKCISVVMWLSGVEVTAFDGKLTSLMIRFWFFARMCTTLLDNRTHSIQCIREKWSMKHALQKVWSWEGCGPVNLIRLFRFWLGLFWVISMFIKTIFVLHRLDMILVQMWQCDRANWDWAHYNVWCTSWVDA